ncbi:MAG: hypothetical protein SH856_03555 [Flavobacteriales bacterium]|nr:hypothetical protein [Flavobacteriales bacterium]
MKIYFKIFAFIFSVAILAACTAEENPMIKEARDISASLMTEKTALDSTIDAKIASISTTWGTMMADTANMPDSTTMMMWEGKVASLKTAKGQLSGWMAPEIPADDAMGEKKPEDVLAEQKQAQSEFEALKASVDAIN